MSLEATPTVEASVNISLRVSRGASGDLHSGVAAVLDGVAAVREATVDRVRGVRPAYTDIRVDVTATLVLALPDDEQSERAVAAALSDGFGITTVQEVGSLDPVGENR